VLRTKPDCFGDDPQILSAAPVILATVGLAHDLGNPPFGHQGEFAIGRWFEENKTLFDGGCVPGSAVSFEPVPAESQKDFLKFEGNAQTLRLVSRLQNTLGPSGLNFTAASLAALMKYTVPSSKTAKGNASTKKFGFFLSESDVVEWVREQTGLMEGQRHPLTWLMEASDDTAYSILDVEDAIKKELFSPEDLRAFVHSKFRNSPDGEGLANRLNDDFQKTDDRGGDLTRIKEIKTSYIRTRLIESVLTGAANEFLSDLEALLDSVG